MSRTIEVTVRQALQTVQNSSTGEVDERIHQMLEDYLRQTWSRIQAQPDTYVMTDLEFAVLNHFRARAEYQNETARKAISRYWDNIRPSNGADSTDLRQMPEEGYTSRVSWMTRALSINLLLQEGFAPDRDQEWSRQFRPDASRSLKSPKEAYTRK
ncbi:hypothetical protein G647_00969 [Cladophialophora carrionii CBS 160.54]|uniref:Uncharacterized protein n=1 Tax=Cladophialophora carrionii CBS 160.54 TaxID=1279043 RepID=V9DNP5_9EURO|nr:uncharacterized protein G647_00969 [Cladophialophora carrionii CBS 160.54]ETI28519.1 hypothetical protein G647_00969 [Cladophialophora carrionii CBS 160.54]